MAKTTMSVISHRAKMMPNIGKTHPTLNGRFRRRRCGSQRMNARAPSVWRGAGGKIRRQGVEGGGEGLELTCRGMAVCVLVGLQASTKERALS